MSLIAFVRDLTPSVLIGKGYGTKTSIVGMNDLITAIKDPNFRAVYAMEQSVS